jgi:hypothetical protein
VLLDLCSGVRDRYKSSKCVCFPFRVPNATALLHLFTTQPRNADPITEPGWRYCTVCNILRSPEVKHCTVCQNCVVGFDHHCPYTSNCIGTLLNRICIACSA